MDYNLNVKDLSDPSDLVQLKRAIRELADECDTLYTETAPNGNIASRIGRRAIYNNAGSYTTWVNIDGDKTWRRIQDYDANIVSIASPTRGSLALYSSGGWIGLSPTTATSGYYLQSQGFGADPLYALLNGLYFTNLANTPSGAGILPVANLGSGSPSASNFLRGDGSWAIPSSVYTAGDYFLNGDYGIYLANSASFNNVTEMYLTRSGTLRVKFWLFNGSGTAHGRIYRNGVAVGTDQSGGAGGVQYSEDISGWSAGDLLQLYIRDENGGNSIYGGILEIFEGTPASPVAALKINTYKQPRFFRIPIVPATIGMNNLGEISDLALNSGAVSAVTALYVKTAATTWTAK